MTPAALLLSLPICWQDRAEAGRRERIENFAAAIVEAAPAAVDQAALITISWYESRLCRAVMVGERRGGWGIGPFQIEPGSNREPPFAGLEISDLSHAAGEALWLWRHSACGGSWRQRFAGYAGSRDCRFPQAAARSRFMGWVYGQLQAPPQNS